MIKMVLTEALRSAASQVMQQQGRAMATQAVLATGQKVYNDLDPSVSATFKISV